MGNKGHFFTVVPHVKIKPKEEEERTLHKSILEGIDQVVKAQINKFETKYRQEKKRLFSVSGTTYFENNKS